MTVSGQLVEDRTTVTWHVEWTTTHGAKHTSTSFVEGMTREDVRDEYAARVLDLEDTASVRVVETRLHLTRREIGSFTKEDVDHG